MSQSPEPENGAQRSVAELLARYGEPSPSGGRRRRRAPDSEETAPQSIIERVGPGSPPAARPQRPGRRRAPEPAEPAEPAEQLPEASEIAPPAGFADPPRPRVAADPPFPLSGTHRSSPIAPAPHRDGRNGGTPNGDRASVTEQLPRIEAGPAVVPSRAPLPPHPPEQTAPPEPAAPPEPDDSAAPAGLAGDAGDDRNTGDRQPTSAAREWAVVTGQVGGGVVGGAVLWLACEWLWQSIPVLALIVALVVITGLVWVVRRVRRADDLQTTVVAVLVGLFVTVSPAALLLVGH